MRIDRGLTSPWAAREHVYQSDYPLDVMLLGIRLERMYNPQMTNSRVLPLLPWPLSVL